MGVTGRRLPLRFWRSIIADIIRIVPVYSKMNRIMSLGLDDDVRSYGISLLKGCATCMDVGSGPGDSIVMLTEECGYVIGVEPSAELASLSLARCRGPGCDVVVAVVEYLPFRSGSVYCAASFFAARDFLDLESSLFEFSRVVKCRLAIGDIFLAENRFARAIEMVWVCLIVPVLAIILARRLWRSYLTLCRTLKGWISASGLASRLASYGWSKLYVKRYVFGGLGVVYASKGSRCYNRR